MTEFFADFLYRIKFRLLYIDNLFEKVLERVRENLFLKKVFPILLSPIEKGLNYGRYD